MRAGVPGWVPVQFLRRRFDGGVARIDHLWKGPVDARSGPRNIAEGFGRFKHPEFAQFDRIAKGSEAEILNHLIDACDQQLLTRDEFLRSEHLVKRALKAANGLIRYLESTPDPPAPRWKPKPPKAP